MENTPVRHAIPPALPGVLLRSAFCCMVQQCSPALCT